MIPFRHITCKEQFPEQTGNIHHANSSINISVMNSTDGRNNLRTHGCINIDKMNSMNGGSIHHANSSINIGEMRSTKGRNISEHFRGNNFPYRINSN